MGIHEFMELKVDVKELKADAKQKEKHMNTLKVAVKESDMERKTFKHTILQNLILFGRGLPRA